MKTRFGSIFIHNSSALWRLVGEGFCLSGSFTWFFVWNLGFQAVILYIFSGKLTGSGRASRAVYRRASLRLGYWLVMCARVGGVIS